MRIIVGKERESYEPELNYRMWDIALRNGTLVRRIWDVGIANNVERFLYRTFGNGFPALLTLYIRKWTPFLRWRVQLHRIRGRTPRTETLDWYDAKDSERVVRTYQEVDVSPVSPSSTTQDTRTNAHVRIIRLIRRIKTQAKNGFTVWIRFVS